MELPHIVSMHQYVFASIQNICLHMTAMHLTRSMILHVLTTALDNGTTSLCAYDSGQDGYAAI